MNAYNANWVNALALMLVSFWDYFDALNSSMVLFIPFFIGIAIMVLNNGVRFQNRTQMVATLFLTVFSLIFIFIGGKHHLISKIR